MGGISRTFFNLETGMLVVYEGRKYRVTRLLSVESVLAEEIGSDKPERLRIEQISPVDESECEKPLEHDLHYLSEEQWSEAQRRFHAIKPLLDDPIRTRAVAEESALKAGVHVSTLYRWMKLYQEAGHVAALVPQKRGRKEGSFFISEEQERVIESAIEDMYLSGQRHKPVDIVEEVNRRCRVAKMKAPHGNTVRLRLSQINPRVRLKRRGFKDVARDTYSPIQGAFPGATHPFSVVQIDHTEAGIILVDEVTREPIARPWLTLAIDVFSRMVAGIYITFEKPSSISVGMCVSQAMCPKREYLTTLGVSGEWPVWGKIDVVHVDNAKEFRGKVLERGCRNYNSDLQWRPVQLPHFGGHIERLMGTVENEIRKLPGATFSNIAQRRGYDSEKESALTLKEFEVHIVDFIVNVYHQRLHNGIAMSPKKKWELGILGNDSSPGIGILPIPEDPLRVQLDFMPFFERTVQRYGIQIDHIHYYDPCLEPYINAMDPEDSRRKRLFLVRRDPRDISKIYFLDPADNRYVEIAYYNIGLPAMSAWELNEVLRKLRDEGRQDIDEHLIFDTLDRMRNRIEAAKSKTKAARKQAARIPKPKPKQDPKKKPQSSTVVEVISNTSGVIEDDPFAEPIEPFSDVRVKR